MITFHIALSSHGLSISLVSRTVPINPEGPLGLACTIECITNFRLARDANTRTDRRTHSPRRETHVNLQAK